MKKFTRVESEGGIESLRNALDKNRDSAITLVTPQAVFNSIKHVEKVMCAYRLGWTAKSINSHHRAKNVKAVKAINSLEESEKNLFAITKHINNPAKVFEAKLRYRNGEEETIRLRKKRKHGEISS